MVRGAWLGSLAIAAAAWSAMAAAAEPPASPFRLGMTGAEAAQRAGLGPEAAAARAVSSGPVTAILCQGVVVAVQEEAGSTSSDYEAAAARLDQELGEGRRAVSETSVPEPQVEATYWDADGFEIVLTLFRAPSFTRVFQTSQIPGLPGCD